MISYIGIDLGQKGALTVQKFIPGCKPKFSIIPFWQRYGGTRLRTYTIDEYYSMLEEVIYNSGKCYVAIEHPVFMPQNGKKAIASLHENFGLTRGILTGLGVSDFWLPKPTQWKAVINAKGSDKSRMTQLAKVLIPKRQITKLNLPLNDMTSDSVLISEACRRHFQD